MASNKNLFVIIDDTLPWSKTVFYPTLENVEEKAPQKVCKGQKDHCALGSSKEICSREGNKEEEAEEACKVRHVEQVSSNLYFKHNTALGPPYHILLDTNFINFSIKNKLDIIDASMEALYAQVIPYVTDCVIGELEKLGGKYRIALKVAKRSSFHSTPLHAQRNVCWWLFGTTGDPA